MISRPAAARSLFLSLGRGGGEEGEDTILISEDGQAKGEEGEWEGKAYFFLLLSFFLSSDGCVLFPRPFWCSVRMEEQLQAAGRKIDKRGLWQTFSICQSNRE